MGFGFKIAEGEEAVKDLARAAAKQDLVEIERLTSRLRPLETTDDVAAMLKDVDELQKEKKRRGSALQGTLKNLAIVRERFFRELASSTTQFRAFANARDLLTKEMDEALSRAERQGRSGKDVRRDYDKKFDDLENKASKIVGQRVKIQDFETLVTRSRSLTSAEEAFVADAKSDAETLGKELKRFRKANNAAIVRVSRAIEALSEFAGVQSVKVGQLDVSAQVSNATGNALNKLRTFLQALQSEQSDLAIGIRQAEAIVEAARPGMTIEAAETFAARLSNLSLLAAAVSVIAGAGASPVVGVLLALGLVAKLFNRVFSEIAIARRLLKK